jgi:hypothetical protein
MKKTYLLLITLLSFVASAADNINLKKLQAKHKLQSGFIGQLFDQETGRLYLKINNLNSEFIYQSSLPQGLGSNDIGLDRGQLSEVRLVEFNRVGNKLLLVQKNTQYRAVSNNLQESRSVQQAFASSILWSFPIVDSHKSWLLVDASDFILQDIHGVVRKLAERKQGSFKRDKSRSAIFRPRSKSFPDNTELEASITFTSDKPGKFVQQAAINPFVVSLRMHHSFIRLPKPGYQPRKFHPQSGFWSFDYQDYAQPINRPITQRFIGRHRLEKKNPEAVISEAVKPIIYYLDLGAPEPVRTALINGASWWDQAFESIGYKNAFQVKILPDDADPMDVRYNVIQWVHRATRGWSYGFGVTDPRNGEIIKGHVSLGSLRVRQDYLIAQGMLSRFTADNSEDIEQDKELMDLALARIRQLTAHEVGHTLGLAHNFAASTFNRASVMDYPHPLFELEKDPLTHKDKIVSNNAYAKNIGIWDKATIAYGYQTFADGKQQAGLAKILADNKNASMLFISDPDSLKISDAHPRASLWDNGANTIDELQRVIKLRQLALHNFGEASLKSARPYSDLQEILMPVYYFHRYQATAAAKWLGGVDYDYSMKVIAESANLATPADPKEQQRALEVLLKTLTPEFLSIDKELQQQIFPKAYGYRADRESLVGHSGAIFDPIALSSASVQHSLSLILEPHRLARLQQQNMQNRQHLSLQQLTTKLHEELVNHRYKNTARLIHQASVDLLYSNYLNLIHDASVSIAIKTEIYAALMQQKNYLRNKIKRLKSTAEYNPFYVYQLSRLENISIKNIKSEQLLKLPKMPPGSPI